MKKPTPSEQRIVLPNVNWQQFETLLVELGDERVAHLTYDRGKLEMITPLPEHDRCNKLIESLILVLADELDLAVETVSPILLTAPDRGLAAELDEGYYIDQKASLSDRNQVDITRHPSPDLAVEISMTKSTLDKSLIYADLGIPEVWRYVTKPGDEVLQGNLSIYRLDRDQYVQQENSILFPFLPAQRVLQFIEQSDTIGLVQSLQILRQWIQEKGL